MDEQGMWDSLGLHLTRLGLDPVRVENVAAEGTPDVNYTHGVMELKYLDAWPAREGTLVRIPTLIDRPRQVAFLAQRWAVGGPAWLMTRVGRQLLLHAGCEARFVRLGRTREELEQMCLWRTNAQGAATPEGWQTLRHLLRWEQEALPAPQRAHLLRLIALKAASEVAADLGWTTGRVLTAEHADGQDSSDLVEYWVC